MSFKEVMNLRKSGDLNSALKLAKEDLSQVTEADDKEKIMWASRALSWVYYDLIKVSVGEKDQEAFLGYLLLVKELSLSESETMFYDQLSWQIGSMVFQMKSGDTFKFPFINKIFDVIKEFHFTKPSESYSFLYKAFHKDADTWTRYLEFADWWGFQNFQPKDFSKEKMPNGKSIISLVERAYMYYSKVLLHFYEENSTIERSEVDIIFIQSPRSTVKANVTKVEVFLNELEVLIEDNPSYKYLPYYKAKLLLLLGDEKSSLEAIIPFARQKQDEFWVWEVMTELFSDEDERKLACYCKALSLDTPDEFLVKTRKNFAEFLIGRSAFDAAKTEIKQLIATRELKEWKISSTSKAWMNSEWYLKAKDLGSNEQLYANHKQIAEDLLVVEVPEELVAVEYVNTNKKMVTFIKSKNETGFFKYLGYLENVHIGEVLKVRLQKIGEEGYHKVLSASKEDVELEGVLREFSGSFEAVPGKSFGFVDDIFINPELLENFNVSNQESVEGKAIISYDKKKSKWGWKAYTISKQD